MNTRWDIAQNLDIFTCKLVHRHNESHLFILLRIASSSKHIDSSAFAEELKDLSDQGIDT